MKPSNADKGKLRRTAAGLGVCVSIMLGTVAVKAQMAQPRSQIAHNQTAIADAQLSKVLGQLDAASARFQSASASFTWDQLTAVVQDHDIQKGTIAFRRGGKGIAMVAHVLTEDGKSAPKDVLFSNGQLELYQPEIKQETILQAGTYRGIFESYLVLGFGGSGQDLRANWNVTYEGTETMDGVSVAKLGLSPKNPTGKEMFSRIDIWIDPTTAASHKQIFYAASGDNRTAVYQDIKLNSTPESAFTKLKIPSGVQVVRK